MNHVREGGQAVRQAGGITAKTNSVHVRCRPCNDVLASYVVHFLLFISFQDHGFA